MKKTVLLLLAVIICLMAACGSPRGFTLETDSITIYEIGSQMTAEVTDETLIGELAAAADMESWKRLTGRKRVSAAPVYVLDFGNDTCIGWLGDGYILAGTGYESSEDLQSFSIHNGKQYQVSTEFTDILEKVIVESTIG